MSKALKDVNDEEHLVSGLHPLLLKQAGKKTENGIELMFQLALLDYTQEMPPAIINFLNINNAKYYNVLNQ